MTTRGLIPEEWLVSYAAGALSEAHATLVATHVSYHPELQKTVADAEDIGGALMASAEPAALTDTDIDALLDKMDALPPLDAADTDTSTSDLPSPLAAYLGKDLNDLNWRTLTPKLAKFDLFDGPNGEKLWLFKAKGGTKMPEHDHGGLEMTLVLQGGYKVGDKHFTPGLVEVADADVTDHLPIIDEGEDCICLVVTEGKMIPKSLIARLAQPFIGI